MVAGKMTRFLGSVMAVWMFVLMYMGLNLYQLVEESRQAGNEISRISNEVSLLKRENDKLRLEGLTKTAMVIKQKAREANEKEEAEIRERLNRELSEAKSKLQDSDSAKEKLLKAHKELDTARTKIRLLENKLRECRSKKGPSKNFENLRRRVENYIKEMWFYLSAQVTKTNRMLPEGAKTNLNRILEEFGHLQRITALEFQSLITMDGAQAHRDNLATMLSTVVQDRLNRLQNPHDCDNAKKLVCSLNKGCGYGCQMHHIMYCFIIAYSTKRTMIIDSTGWRYSPKGWTGVFQSISKSCTDYKGKAVEWGANHEKHQVVHLPIVDSLFPRPNQMPLSVPRDIADDIGMFHGHPFIWWIGQFCKYLFRFQPDLKKEIKIKKVRFNFKGPIVGVQVRRTDKINLEAAYHSIEEYMYWVDLYYKKLELTQAIDRRRVFLASDDPTVLGEAARKYPEYEFLSDNTVSRDAGLDKRYTESSLHGVITDIELLSDTDFLVCTFSSQVCRLAYEIMNSKHTDASNRFRSLDDVYYFGGQSEHKVRAIWPHKAVSRGQLDLEIGDLVGIAGNHWDGQAKGKHLRTQKIGVFPAYKVEDDMDVVDFPFYGD